MSDISNQVLSHKLDHTQNFSIELAIKLKDVELAIIVQFFFNVICKHKREGRNNIENRTWNYCTAEELQDYFPYWTIDQIKGRLRKLVKIGVFVAKKHSSSPFDQTNWYAFSNEEEFGISNISYVVRNRTMDNFEGHNPQNPIAPCIDTPLYQRHIDTYDFNDTATPSVTSKKYKKVSLAKIKMNAEQQEIFDWLTSQKIDSDHDTLSWWARTYTKDRLLEVYREAHKRKPASIGAYMNKLLRTQSTVTTGRVEINKEYLHILGQAFDIHNVVITQKYAKIPYGNTYIEVNFDMDPDAFACYVKEKLLGAEAMR